MAIYLVVGMPYLVTITFFAFVFPQNDPTISSIILDEEEVKAKELEKELARKDSVFEDEDLGIGSSDEGEEMTAGRIGDN